ncbi:hypothetical protein B0I33_103447 [Prauserella shujinwangii]|uniref:Thioredoxin n=1 Tax=Prauserella shujinwangii TaxID=1453103 RepID=A0A2T0LZ67_9PSEU|nr:thioredoxin [Prauserella shujinwangii]PRX49411.1 hypothetical protein B0I33_103447 [Prauserella shujinwangii]
MLRCYETPRLLSARRAYDEDDLRLEVYERGIAEGHPTRRTRPPRPRPGSSARSTPTPCPLTTLPYQVAALPTLLLFRGGEPIAPTVGARSKARLLAELDEALLR